MSTNAVNIKDKFVITSRDGTYKFVELLSKFVEQGLSLTGKVYGRNKLEIINVFLGISSDKRAEFVEQSLRLTEELNSLDKYFVFECFKNVRRENLLAIVVRGVEHLERNPHQRTRAGVMAIIAVAARENEELRMMAEEGINVHDGERDSRTGNALRLLIEATKEQLPIGTGARSEKVQVAIECFKSELEMWSQEAGKAEIVEKAKKALGDIYCEGFPPLLTGDIGGRRLTIGGLQTTGEEFLVRIWIYIEAIADETDKGMAKESLSLALADSINGYGRLVCNPGKVQRIMVGVLQGRLDGVNIDGMAYDLDEEEQDKLTADDAVKAFFRDEKKQKITNWKSLKEVGEIFVKENPRVEEQGFYKGLLKSACDNYLDGIPDDIADLVDNNQLEDERVSQFLNGK